MKMQKLTQAVLNVMEECKGIDKSMTVWSWRNTYKWVSDKDVKLKIWESMRKHWLILLPTWIEVKTEKTEWEEEWQWVMKQKKSYFTEVITSYKLIHKDWWSIDLKWYWQWVDPQDKWAGKATTYAMKYTLLYTFMVATGHIDDSDNTHSDDIDKPKEKPYFSEAKFKALEAKKDVYKNFDEALKAITKIYKLSLEMEIKIRKLYVEMKPREENKEMSVEH